MATDQSKTIVLSDEEKKFGRVDELKKKAEIFSINVDTVSRVIMVIVIAGIFIGLNWAVIGFVQEAFRTDIALLSASGSFKPTDRVITTNIFISLIGATVVQVGVATIAIVSYLFPKKAVEQN